MAIESETSFPSHPPNHEVILDGQIACTRSVPLRVDSNVKEKSW